jgi:serine/threonine protein kinase
VQRSGVVKLLDFGVAKALQGNAHLGPLTAAGVAIGTPRYMAPEQAQGQQVDPRSDVYAVGLVFWEMLAGRPPYHHLDALAAVVTASAQGLPDIAATGVSVPADVKAALERATAREPAARYGSAAAFAADLRMARSRLDGTPTAAEKVTARYETSLTSLMPVLSEVTEHNGLLGDPTDASAHALTRVSTTPVDDDPGAPRRPSLISEPTEALTLRDSLPFDPREQATPTSLPPAAPRNSSIPSPSIAPPVPPPPSPRGVPWWALPAVVLVSVLGTWFLLRPRPVAPAVAPAEVASSAPVVEASVRPLVTVAAPLASAPPVASEAAVASAPGAPVVAGKTAETPAQGDKVPAVPRASKPAEAKKTAPPSRPTTTLPGSGL